jgi:hypothetical protein
MKEDHVTQYSKAFRKLEKTAGTLGLPNTASEIGNVANQLETYKQSAGQFVLKSPPNQDKDA